MTHNGPELRLSPVQCLYDFRVNYRAKPQLFSDPKHCIFEHKSLKQIKILLILKTLHTHMDVFNYYG